jgi:hypothetical protein
MHISKFFLPSSILALSLLSGCGGSSQSTKLSPGSFGGETIPNSTFMAQSQSGHVAFCDATISCYVSAPNGTQQTVYSGPNGVSEIALSQNGRYVLVNEQINNGPTTYNSKLYLDGTEISLPAIPSGGERPLRVSNDGFIYGTTQTSVYRTNGTTTELSDFAPNNSLMIDFPQRSYNPDYFWTPALSTSAVWYHFRAGLTVEQVSLPTYPNTTFQIAGILTDGSQYGTATINGDKRGYVLSQTSTVQFFGEPNVIGIYGILEDGTVILRDQSGYIDYAVNGTERMIFTDLLAESYPNSVISSVAGETIVLTTSFPGTPGIVILRHN